LQPLQITGAGAFGSVVVADVQAGTAPKSLCLLLVLALLWALIELSYFITENFRQRCMAKQPKVSFAIANRVRFRVPGISRSSDLEILRWQYLQVYFDVDAGAGAASHL